LGGQKMTEVSAKVSMALQGNNVDDIMKEIQSVLHTEYQQANAAPDIFYIKLAIALLQHVQNGFDIQVGNRE
jgi:hypothetical protein